MIKARQHVCPGFCLGHTYLRIQKEVILRVHPMADEAPGWTPYRYGFQNPVKYIDPNGMFEDEASALAAQEKAVEQYGKDRVTEVYYNPDKSEWGFGVAANEEQQENRIGPDNVPEISHTKTTGVYDNNFLKEKGRTRSINFSFAFVGGLSLIFGEVFDSMGGKKNFFTYGGNVGFNLEFGVENTEITPNAGNSAGFSVSQYKGKSAGYVGGFSGASGSYFGSFVPSERSPGAEFMRIPDRIGGYHEMGLGYSRGIRIGGMWSQTTTTLR